MDLSFDTTDPVDRFHDDVERSTEVLGKLCLGDVSGCFFAFVLIDCSRCEKAREFKRRKQQCRGKVVLEWRLFVISFDVQATVKIKKRSPSSQRFPAPVITSQTKSWGGQNKIGDIYVNLLPPPPLPSGTCTFPRLLHHFGTICVVPEAEQWTFSR
jgi:hypothetical protein